MPKEAPKFIEKWMETYPSGYSGDPHTEELTNSLYYLRGLFSHGIINEYAFKEELNSLIGEYIRARFMQSYGRYIHE